MQNLVNKILKVLKDHVRQNNLEIGLNQEDINRLLAEGSSSLKKKDDLEYKKSINKELSEENDDFIKMQLQITEFMEKHGHIMSDPDSYEESEEDNSLPYFTQTILGQIKFGPDHPQFNNSRFFHELLRHYQEKEDYEMCDRLVKLKRSINKF